MLYGVYLSPEDIDMKWFNSQSRLVQIVLLLIPFVNWVVELYVRWTAFVAKQSLLRFLLAILVTVGGLAFGWIDLIWCLLFKHLIGAAD